MAWLRSDVTGDLINADHIIIIAIVENPDKHHGEPHFVAATLKIDAGPNGGDDYVVPLAEGDWETCEAVLHIIARCLTTEHLTGETFTP